MPWAAPLSAPREMACLNVGWTGEETCRGRRRDVYRLRLAIRLLYCM